MFGFVGVVGFWWSLCDCLVVVCMVVYEANMLPMVDKVCGIMCL